MSAFGKGKKQETLQGKIPWLFFAMGLEPAFIRKLLEPIYTCSHVTVEPFPGVDFYMEYRYGTGHGFWLRVPMPLVNDFLAQFRTYFDPDSTFEARKALMPALKGWVQTNNLKGVYPVDAGSWTYMPKHFREKYPGMHTGNEYAAQQALKAQQAQQAEQALKSEQAQPAEHNDNAACIYEYATTNDVAFIYALCEGLPFAYISCLYVLMLLSLTTCSMHVPISTDW